jgi:hypothetical protein
VQGLQSVAARASTSGLLLKSLFALALSQRRPPMIRAADQDGCFLCDPEGYVRHPTEEKLKRVSGTKRNPAHYCGT